VQRDVSTWQSIREHRALTDKLTFFPFFLSFFAKKSSMSGSSGAACVDSATCAHGCGCGCETLTAQSVRTGADARVRTTAVRMVKCQASFNLAGELSWEVEVAHMCVCYIGKGAIIGQVLCPQRMRCWLQHTVLDIAGGCGTLARQGSSYWPSAVSPTHALLAAAHSSRHRWRLWHTGHGKKRTQDCREMRGKLMVCWRWKLLCWVGGCWAKQVPARPLNNVPLAVSHGCRLVWATSQRTRNTMVAVCTQSGHHK
jgi:hypothetical protein